MAINKLTVGAMVNSVLGGRRLSKETQHKIDEIVTAFYKEREEAERDYNSYLVRSMAEFQKALVALSENIDASARSAADGAGGE